jgi:electron transfer flavoprotein beta subunit
VRKSVKGFVMHRKNVIFKESSAADRVAKLKASLASEGLC